MYKNDNNESFEFEAQQYIFHFKNDGSTITGKHAKFKILTLECKEILLYQPRYDFLLKNLSLYIIYLCI